MNKKRKVRLKKTIELETNPNMHLKKYLLNENKTSMIEHKKQIKKNPNRINLNINPHN